MVGALESSLATFAGSVKNPKAPAATAPTTATSTTPTVPPMGGTGGPVMVTAAVPGGPMMMMHGPGMGGLAGGLLSGSPLSTAEVASLKSAVETFAKAYTSGSNPTADKAAADALGKAIGTIAQSHMPAGGPMGAMPMGAMPISTNGSTGSATATPAMPPSGALPFLAWQNYVSAPANANAATTGTTSSSTA